MSSSVDALYKNLSKEQCIKMWEQGSEGCNRICSCIKNFIHTSTWIPLKDLMKPSNRQEVHFT